MTLAWKPAVRDVFQFSVPEFEAMWDAVREHLLIEVYDNGGRPQGYAVVKVTKQFKADKDGAFFLCQYLGCSDEYYSYWVSNEMSADPYHHVCRSSLRTCKRKVGRDQIVHVLRWNHVTKHEADALLRSWGVAERPPLKRKLRPAKSERTEGATSKAKPGPPILRRSRTRSPKRRRSARSSPSPPKQTRMESSKELRKSDDEESSYEYVTDVDNSEVEVKDAEQRKRTSRSINPKTDNPKQAKRQKSSEPMRHSTIPALDAVVDEAGDRSRSRFRSC